MAPRARSVTGREGPMSTAAAGDPDGLVLPYPTPAIACQMIVGQGAYRSRRLEVDCS